MACRETEGILEDMRRAVCSDNSFNAAVAFKRLVDMEMFQDEIAQRRFILDVARKLEAIA